MRIEYLIKALATDAKPVRRLSSPMVRLSVWLAASTAYAALIVFIMGSRREAAVRRPTPDSKPRRQLLSGAISFRRVPRVSLTKLMHQAPTGDQLDRFH